MHARSRAAPQVAVRRAESRRMNRLDVADSALSADPLFGLTQGRFGTGASMKATTSGSTGAIQRNGAAKAPASSTWLARG